VASSRRAFSFSQCEKSGFEDVEAILCSNLQDVFQRSSVSQNILLELLLLHQ
jgi:hypothetical protein